MKQIKNFSKIAIGTRVVCEVVSLPIAFKKDSYFKVYKVISRGPNWVRVSSIAKNKYGNRSEFILNKNGKSTGFFDPQFKWFKA